MSSGSSTSAGNLTGYKKFDTLEAYYIDDGSTTGQTIANTGSNYIAPTYDITSCPITTFSIAFSAYSSLGVNPSSYNGNYDNQTVSGVITVTLATYRIKASATVYTNNSTTISTTLTITSGLYTQKSGSSGTTLSSSYIDLAPGFGITPATYSYTLNVIGSGPGGSGSGGMDITKL
jgi:hypothetical protein